MSAPQGRYESNAEYRARLDGKKSTAVAPPQPQEAPAPAKPAKKLRKAK